MHTWWTAAAIALLARRRCCWLCGGQMWQIADWVAIRALQPLVPPFVRSVELVDLRIVVAFGVEGWEHTGDGGEV